MTMYYYCYTNMHASTVRILICQRSSLGASPVPSCTSTVHTDIQSDQLYYLVLSVAVCQKWVVVC